MNRGGGAHPLPATLENRTGWGAQNVTDMSEAYMFFTPSLIGKAIFRIGYLVSVTFMDAWSAVTVMFTVTVKAKRLVRRGFLKCLILANPVFSFAFHSFRWGFRNKHGQS